MCRVFPSNRQKLEKRKCNLQEISSASPKAYRRQNLLGYAEPILGKIQVT